MKKYGNASEPHIWGQKAREAVDKSREQIAQVLGAKSGEIIFTSCATESINLAHRGLVEKIKGHIITTSIEHKAVLETCQHLEKLGWAKVTYLPVDKDGMIKVEDVKRAIKPETVLVSVMYVNNEVGTIQPIAEIGRMIKKKNKSRIKNQESRIYFHTDATQAIQYLNCNVDELGVDLLSFTGHKIYAPKGIGVLYVKKNTPLVRQQDGGGQEFNLRAGTENVPYIVGLGKAIKEFSNSNFQFLKKIERLRDRLIKGVLKISGTRLTGHPEKRVAHIVSFVIEGVEGESILLYLSEQGVAAASGSACTSGLLKSSHVLTAMGLPAEIAHGSLRFSLGKNNTDKDVDYVLKVLPGIIKKLRAMAPGE